MRHASILSLFWDSNTPSGYLYKAVAAPLFPLVEPEQAFPMIILVWLTISKFVRLTVQSSLQHSRAANIYEMIRSNHAGFGPRRSRSLSLGMLGALGFSYNQQTDTDMKFRLGRTYPLGDGKIEEDLALVKSGGISNWQVGVGVSITKWARIGLGYQRIYFNNQTSLIKKTEGFLNDTLIDSTNTVFTGNGIRAGIQSSIQNLTLGISGQYVFKSDARDKRTIRGTRVQENSPQKDAPITENLTYELKPAPSIAFGASYVITPEWMAAVELEAILWNRFYSEIETVDEVDRAYNFSIGTQYIPAPNLLTPKYYEIMQYRGIGTLSCPPTASEFAFTLGRASTPRKVVAFLI